MDYREEFNALVGGGIGTGHLTLTFDLSIMKVTVIIAAVYKLSSYKENGYA